MANNRMALVLAVSALVPVFAGANGFGDLSGAYGQGLTLVSERDERRQREQEIERLLEAYRAQFTEFERFVRRSHPRPEDNGDARRSVAYQGALKLNEISAYQNQVLHGQRPLTDAYEGWAAQIQEVINSAADNHRRASAELELEQTRSGCQYARSCRPRYLETARQGSTGDLVQATSRIASRLADFNGNNNAQDRALNAAYAGYQADKAANDAVLAAYTEARDSVVSVRLQDVVGDAYLSRLPQRGGAIWVIVQHESTTYDQSRFNITEVDELFGRFPRSAAAGERSFQVRPVVRRP